MLGWAGLSSGDGPVVQWRGVERRQGLQRRYMGAVCVDLLARAML
eukprot:CAMPEP_0185042606 /NCGR_PEP_ID=MMETSP1103-20130426/42447_1 /TAXON_ID=36769 /ORGANISM="Paraphysomonas bandaiensis, Strain Caron Lab Isolate" /LENGTH=44 /DNA_ID= /DNA_START= /DNA_END= /DNA_ORIENTATION=